MFLLRSFLLPTRHSSSQAGHDSSSSPVQLEGVDEIHREQATK